MFEKYFFALVVSDFENFGPSPKAYGNTLFASKCKIVEVFNIASLTKKLIAVELIDRRGDHEKSVKNYEKIVVLNFSL